MYFVVNRNDPIKGNATGKLMLKDGVWFLSLHSDESFRIHNYLIFPIRSEAEKFAREMYEGQISDMESMLPIIEKDLKEGIVTQEQYDEYVTDLKALKAESPYTIFNLTTVVESLESQPINLFPKLH